MDLAIAVLKNIFDPVSILFLVVGMVVGVVFGAIPGLNGQVGIALLVPFTYGMSPAHGLLMLGGIYMGSSYGGSVSAILINCPGTGEAACTALDGNPMSQKGRANEALTYSVMSSAFGGVVGILAMIFFTPLLAKVALKFGPAEMFMVSVGGLIIVGSMLGKSPAKGFIAVGIGLLISCVGMDYSAVSQMRFTFNIPYLRAGLPQIPVMVGFFAVTEMLMLTNREGSLVEKEQQPFKVLDGVKGLVRHRAVLIKSSLIGTAIGILPGTGGAIASFMAYGEAARQGEKSKDKTKFGDGNVEGVIAPESANNAAVGGSFVPMLSLGVPGSATSAIIFGALMIHGLQPGAELFTTHADLVYSFMYGMLLTIPVLLVIGLCCRKVFSHILLLDTSYVIPAVLVFAVIGSYSARNNIMDAVITLVTGFIGVFLKRAKIPIAPIVIGIILGPIVERNFRRCIPIAMAAEKSLFSYIVLRPISLIALALIAIVLFTNFKGKLSQKKSLEG